MRSIRKAKGRRARLRAPSGARPEGPCGVRTRQTVPFPAPSHTRLAAQSLPLSASAWRPCLPRRRRRRLRRLDLVGLDRLELSTSPLSGVRSNHLSYRPKQFLPKAKLHLPHSLPGSSTTDAKHPQGQGPSEPLRGPVRRIAAKPRSSVRTYHLRRKRNVDGRSRDCRLIMCRCLPDWKTTCSKQGPERQKPASGPSLERR